MWRELWNRYRVQTISVMGFVLFAVVGATAMLLPSVRERLERQGAEAQPAQVQPRAPFQNIINRSCPDDILKFLRNQFCLLR